MQVIFTQQHIEYPIKRVSMHIQVGIVIPSALASLFLMLYITLPLFNYSVSQKREAEFNSKLRPNYDCRGFTAIHYAVLFQQTRIIQTLLDAG